MYQSLFIHLLIEGHLGCLQVWAVMNKAVLSVTFLTVAHFFHIDSTSNVKTLQDLFLKVIASGNVWAQSDLSSSTCPVQTLYFQETPLFHFWTTLNITYPFQCLFSYSHLFILFRIFSSLQSDNLTLIHPSRPLHILPLQWNIPSTLRKEQSDRCGLDPSSSTLLALCP